MTDTSTSATRERILDEAERLFAERGFDATSMRAVTNAAGVNLAAVNYHFGSKDRLLRETMRRCIEPINAERLRRLDAAIERAEDGVPPVEEIVDAFVRPAVEAFADIDRRHCLGLFRLVYGEGTEPTFFREMFGEVVERFAVLGRALPHLTGQEVAWRFHMAVGSMLQLFNHRILEADPRLVEPDTATLSDMLVRWIVAGLGAPAALDAPDTRRAPQPDPHEETPA